MGLEYMPCLTPNQPPLAWQIWHSHGAFGLDTWHRERMDVSAPGRYWVEWTIRMNQVHGLVDDAKAIPLQKTNVVHSNHYQVDSNLINYGEEFACLLPASVLF